MTVIRIISFLFLLASQCGIVYYDFTYSYWLRDLNEALISGHCNHFFQLVMHCLPVLICSYVLINCIAFFLQKGIATYLTLKEQQSYIGKNKQQQDIKTAESVDQDVQKKAIITDEIADFNSRAASIFAEFIRSLVKAVVFFSLVFHLLPSIKMRILGLTLPASLWFMLSLGLYFFIGLKLGLFLQRKMATLNVRRRALEAGLRKQLTDCQNNEARTSIHAIWENQQQMMRNHCLVKVWRTANQWLPTIIPGLLLSPLIVKKAIIFSVFMQIANATEGLYEAGQFTIDNYRDIGFATATYRRIKSLGTNVVLLAKEKSNSTIEKVKSYSQGYRGLLLLLPCLMVLLQIRFNTWIGLFNNALFVKGAAIAPLIVKLLPLWFFFVVLGYLETWLIYYNAAIKTQREQLQCVAANIQDIQQADPGQKQAVISDNLSIFNNMDFDIRVEVVRAVMGLCLFFPLVLKLSAGCKAALFLGLSLKQLLVSSLLICAGINFLVILKVFQKKIPQKQSRDLFLKANWRQDDDFYKCDTANEIFTNQLWLTCWRTLCQAWTAANQWLPTLIPLLFMGRLVLEGHLPISILLQLVHAYRQAHKALKFPLDYYGFFAYYQSQKIRINQYLPKLSVQAASVNIAVEKEFQGGNAHSNLAGVDLSGALSTSGPQFGQPSANSSK
jgi:ABC-type uncharacterized transport system fused permease/ATPase subunit